MGQPGQEGRGGFTGLRTGGNIVSMVKETRIIILFESKSIRMVSSNIYALWAQYMVMYLFDHTEDKWFIKILEIVERQ